MSVIYDKTDMMSDDFSANRFLDTEIGPGLAPVLALFESAGLDSPSYDMVRKWRARDSMPAFWLAKSLLALELVDGAPLSMSKYFTEGRKRCLQMRQDCSGSQPSVFD
jgi:hypothetical protein